METKNYELVIVGGGAAGIMAAISAKRAHPELTIALLDRTFALGRKILVCGAGRCNITNLNLDKDAQNRYYATNLEFVKAILEQFSYQEIVKFFDDLGIELYVERKTNIGKLFPITDQAKTVTALLEDELNRLKINIFLNTEVTKIAKKGETFTISTKTIGNPEVNDSGEFISKYLIFSAGGKTYPALGSDGSGYELAKTLGHTIITPVPSALALEAKNPLSQELQGVKMEMTVTSIIDGQEIKTSTDDVIFTQYGLSGAGILNISREISIHFNREQKNNAEVKLNFFPGKTKDEIKSFLTARWQKRPDQTLEKSLFGIFPNKIPPILLKLLEFDPQTIVGTLTPQQIDTLCEKFSDYRIRITATRGWNEAEFTAGGVDISEVKVGTLESKLIPNLYFCGEILDVDGDIGGFNLSWAWSSGFVAGKLS